MGISEDSGVRGFGVSGFKRTDRDGSGGAHIDSNISVKQITLPDSLPCISARPTLASTL